MRPRIHVLLGLSTAAALLAAAPASAIFLATPLQLAGDRGDAQVGDRVHYTVQPWNASETQRLAGREVVVKWVLVGNHHEHLDEGIALPSLALDEQAHATFDWVVPEAFDDHNVFLLLVLGEEELGRHYLRIGDAEPLMFLAASGPGAGESAGGPPQGQQGSQGKAANVPGPGAVLAVAGVAGAAIALAAGRRKA